MKRGGGVLEDFENKIARAQAGKQMSCRAKTYINPLQRVSVMDSKNKVYMTELLWHDISLLQVSKGTKSWTLLL